MKWKDAPTKYTFQYRSSTGKWLTYVPFFEYRQDAIGTRDLVSARGLEVSDIIELKE